MRDRKNRFYERSVQHIYETKNGFASMLPGMTYTATSTERSSRHRSTLMITIFIFLAASVIDAVLTQSPPGIEFRAPTRNESVEDKEAARSEAAQESTLVYDRESNDIKGLQLEQVRFFRLSGRTVSWTRTEADAQFFGRNDDGTPKRREKTTFHGTLRNQSPDNRKWPGQLSLYAYDL